MNYQGTKKVKIDFTFHIIFNGLSTIEMAVYPCAAETLN